MKKYLFLLAILALCSTTWAQLPLTVQGSLKASGGSPLNGPQDMTFAIFNVPSGGTSLWSESHSGASAVSVTNGIYSARLGFMTPLPASLFTDNLGTLYLEVTVGTNTPMSPRRELQATAYANAVADGAITTSSLATGAVTSDKLASDLKVAFRAHLTSSFNGPSGTTVPFQGVDLNEGGAYVVASNSFVAPSAGVYRFYIRVYSSHYISAIIRVNGVNNQILAYESLTGDRFVHGTELLKLNAGDIVTVYKNESATYLSPYTTFSGERIF